MFGLRFSLVFLGFWFLGMNWFLGGLRFVLKDTYVQEIQGLVF